VHHGNDEYGLLDVGTLDVGIDVGFDTEHELLHEGLPGIQRKRQSLLVKLIYGNGHKEPSFYFSIMASRTLTTAQKIRHSYGSGRKAA
jgi:hypothetical protein